MGTVVNAIGTVAGAAASGPLAIVNTVASIGKDLIERFIPDPQKKLEAQQHLLDTQATLTLAMIDQQNKIMEAASKNQQADPHASGARAYFCYGITTMLLCNYGVFPFAGAVFHWNLPSFQIPMSIMAIFATIMLGWVGIPAGADLVKSVLGMPGDSQVNVMGVKLGNKS